MQIKAISQSCCVCAVRVRRRQLLVWSAGISVSLLQHGYV